MVTISEIIPDLANGQSGSKAVFDKISEQTGFALSPREFEVKIQPWNYRQSSDKGRIIDFERLFFSNYYFNKSFQMSETTPKKMSQSLKTI